MDSKIGFEISMIVVEAIRGRCAGFMILTATVSDIFGGQTNSSILVVLQVWFVIYHSMSTHVHLITMKALHFPVFLFTS